MTTHSSLLLFIASSNSVSCDNTRLYNSGLELNIYICLCKMIKIKYGVKIGFRNVDGGIKGTEDNRSSSKMDK